MTEYPYSIGSELPVIEGIPLQTKQCDDLQYMTFKNGINRKWVLKRFPVSDNSPEKNALRYIIAMIILMRMINTYWTHTVDQSLPQVIHRTCFTGHSHNHPMKQLLFHLNVMVKLRYPDITQLTVCELRSTRLQPIMYITVQTINTYGFKASIL